MSDNYDKLFGWHPYTPIFWPVKVDSHYCRDHTGGGWRYLKPVLRRAYFVKDKPGKIRFEYRDSDLKVCHKT